MTAIWTLRTRRAAGPASDDRDALRDVETRASARCVICVCAPSDNRPAGGPASRTNCGSALSSPTSRAAARSRMKTTPTNSMPRASSPRTSSHGRDRRHFSECTFKLPQWGGLVRLKRATLHGRLIDLAHANDLPTDPAAHAVRAVPTSCRRICGVSRWARELVLGLCRLSCDGVKAELLATSGTGYYKPDQAAVALALFNQALEEATRHVWRSNISATSAASGRGPAGRQGASDALAPVRVYCGPSLSISAFSSSISDGFRLERGARTGPASWPTILAPALMMLTP